MCACGLSGVSVTDTLWFSAVVQFSTRWEHTTKKHYKKPVCFLFWFSLILLLVVVVVLTTRSQGRWREKREVKREESKKSHHQLWYYYKHRFSALSSEVKWTRKVYTSFCVLCIFFNTAKTTAVTWSLTVRCLSAVHTSSFTRTTAKSCATNLGTWYYYRTIRSEWVLFASNSCWIVVFH